MKGQTAGPLIKLIIFAVVTIFCTAVLAVSISNYSGGGRSYHAVFSDVTSLNTGDDIRIAGVRVGQVTGIQVMDRRLARVTFSVRRDWLPASTIATVRYRNLVGQRYIELSQGPGEQGRKLDTGATIALANTRPALNLTTLFNGFRPLFQTLSAADVNRLSSEIINVFQGEGGTIDDLVATTADLTNKIADKDAVIGELVDGLNTVLATVNRRDDQLSALIVNTQHLVSGLAADRDVIGRATTSLGNLTAVTADVLSQTTPSLQGSIAGLRQVAGTIDDRRGDVNRVLANLPEKMRKLGRVGSYGSWFQFYLCGIDVVAGPGYADAPQLALPSGLPTLNVPVYTNAAPRCHGGR